MQNTPTELKSSAADREALCDSVSGSRAGMVGGHMKQTAPIINPLPTPHFTGADLELAKYMHDDVVVNPGQICSFQRDGRIRRAVFERHPKVGDPNVMQVAVFTRRAELSSDRLPIIDVSVTSNYTSHHHVFSSNKTPTDLLRSIVRGEVDYLEKGQRLTKLPSLFDKGGVEEFADGVPLSTVTISHPDLIEDSYDISETAAKMLMAYGHRIIEFSLRSDEYLLDTYGTYGADMQWHPRFMPDVGEAIRDDGLVIAIRRHDPLYAGLEMSAGELRHPSPYFDVCEYVDADPEHHKNPLPTNGSRVIDIQVWRDETAVVNRGLGEDNCILCTEQNKSELDKYALALKSYYIDILHFYFSVEDKEEVVWSTQAYTLIYQALAAALPDVYNQYSATINKIVNRAIKHGDFSQDAVRNKLMGKLPKPQPRKLKDPITTYTVRIVVSYPIPATTSTKIADRSGVKGVVGKVIPDDKMPVDEDGRIVHVMRAQNAAQRRSTFGGLFHIYWNAASEQLKLRLKPMLEANQLTEAWTILIDYLGRYNPAWAEMVNDAYPTQELQMELWKDIYDFTIRIWLPHELDKSTIQICEDLKEYAPRKTKLLLTNYDGTKEWSKDSFYVGMVDTLRLDKTGREFSSVSSPQFNFLGGMECVVSQSHSYPVNNKGIKWGGESERRCVSGYQKKYFDEIHNTSNHPDLQRDITRGLYKTMTPTAPGVLIDRLRYPLGTSQYDKLISNIHRCEGFRLIRKKRED